MADSIRDEKHVNVSEKDNATGKQSIVAQSIRIDKNYQPSNFAEEKKKEDQQARKKQGNVLWETAEEKDFFSAAYRGLYS